MEDIRQVQDERFTEEVEKLVRNAEETRLKKSHQLARRKKVSFVVTLLVVIGASSWFLWTLLMGGDMRPASIALVSMIFVPVALHFWTRQPLDDYRKEFKSQLMPRMAKLLGQLKYRSTGGISLKAVAASRLLPSHKIYEAEDSFAGVYKGTKILVSEARLLEKKGKEPVFDGVFVLLMTPKGKFKGHTIITADDNMIKRWRTSRWKGLSDVSFRSGVRGGSYHVYSDNPEEAVTLADEDMMELLHTLNGMFDNSRITASFFKGNRVFLMIPYEADMFEPGDIFMPVTSKNHALKCKREIEQILHIVDVLNVYEADSALPQDAAGEAATAPAEPSSPAAGGTAEPPAPVESSQAPPPAQTPDQSSQSPAEPADEGSKPAASPLSREQPPASKE